MVGKGKEIGRLGACLQARTLAPCAYRRAIVVGAVPARIGMWTRENHHARWQGARSDRMRCPVPRCRKSQQQQELSIERVRTRFLTEDGATQRRVASLRETGFVRC